MIQVKNSHCEAAPGGIPSTELSENTADQDWLESDVSHLEEYEPYDWGDIDPLTLGKPIKYITDLGFVVEGGKGDA